MNAYIYSMRLNEDRLPVLVRETAHYRVDRRVPFDNPEKFRDLAHDIGLDTMAEEYLYCICMNAKMRVIGLFEVSHGTVNATIASPREIFQKALMLGAVNIVLIHNHPSGDPTPSAEDIALTKLIKEGGDLLHIYLRDHVVIAESTYCSIMCEGYVES